MAGSCHQSEPINTIKMYYEAYTIEPACDRTFIMSWKKLPPACPF
jgi:hypothetical protein